MLDCAMDRIVTWDGIYNARDLGGLRTAAGTTAFGAFYRTARLECLTDGGWQQMYDAGVRTIVDLRNEEERARRDGDPRIDVGALPTVTVVSCPTEDQSDPEFMEICGPYLDSPEYYRENLRRWPEKFAAVFRALSAAVDGGIVVHCAGGRDRTGLITTMLLLLAGVEHADIAADYELSCRAVNEYFKTLSAPQARETPRTEAELRVVLDHRTAALRELVEGFDVEHYLLDAGLTSAELDKVKNRLLTLPEWHHRDMSFDVEFPQQLTGPGVTLRALAASDWELEYALSRVSDVPQWTYYPVDMDEETARHRVERTKHRHEQRIAARYAVMHDGVTLGTAGMGLAGGDEPEVFYVLLREGRGRGLATGAARLLSDWMLDHGCQRVALETIVGNIPSERVAQGAGFVHESTHAGDQRGEPVQLKRWIRHRSAP